MFHLDPFLVKRYIRKMQKNKATVDSRLCFIIARNMIKNNVRAERMQTVIDMFAAGCTNNGAIVFKEKIG